MPLTKDQSRMARAAIDISGPELGREAGVSKTTVSDFEKGAIQIRQATQDKIEGYLSKFVIFVGAKEGEHGAGVLLRSGMTAGSWRNGEPNGELHPVDEAGNQLMDYFSRRREDWAALPEEARAAMLSTIYGRVPEVDPFAGIPDCADSSGNG